MKRIFIGVDVGKTGSIAYINGESGELSYYYNKNTDQDVNDFVLGIVDLIEQGFKPFTFIENVSSSPQMGVKSAFTFGESNGFLTGLFVAHKIRFETVSPVKWQRVFKIKTRVSKDGKTAHKNELKAKAQQLWPSVRITHANADAILLAEYCRLHYSKLL